jgi:hypothetical protein
MSTIDKDFNGEYSCFPISFNPGWSASTSYTTGIFPRANQTGVIDYVNMQDARAIWVVANAGDFLYSPIKSIVSATTTIPLTAIIAYKNRS